MNRAYSSFHAPAEIPTHRAVFEHLAAVQSVGVLGFLALERAEDTVFEAKRGESSVGGPRNFTRCAAFVGLHNRMALRANLDTTLQRIVDSYRVGLVSQR